MRASWWDALTKALLDFDGKTTTALERFAAAHALDTDLIAALCDFAGSGENKIQGSATWLLKRYGVTGAALTPEQTETLLRLLLVESSWLARLHALQMMDSLAVPETMAADLMDALAEHARGDNTFIRAWSVHGAAALADQHAAYREGVLDLMLEAGQDAAPSVQARLRQTRKRFGWL